MIIIEVSTGSAVVMSASDNFVCYLSVYLFTQC